MNSKKLIVVSRMALLSVSLLALAGCYNPFKKSQTSEEVPTTLFDPVEQEKEDLRARGPVIVEFSNGSRMRMGDVDYEIENVLAANPYTKNMSASQITPDMKEMFFRDVLHRKLVDLWARENKVEDDAVFKADLRQTLRLVEQAKRAEFFANKVRRSLGETIFDRDLKASFDKNRESYIKTPGGVQTIGVRFSLHDDARAFADSIDVVNVNNVTMFDQFAKDAGFTPKSFGRISNQAPRGANQAIVDVALSRKTFPSIEIVTVGEDEFWVVLFESRQETIYYNFDEVKEQLRAMAENEQFATRIESELKLLQDKYVKNLDLSAFKTDTPSSLMMPDEDAITLDEEMLE